MKSVTLWDWTAFRSQVSVENEACSSVAIHYSDVIMGAKASQITSITFVFSTAYSEADKRKHQSSASLTFVRGIHRWPMNSLHKWPVTRKMFPFDYVIMTGLLSLGHMSKSSHFNSFEDQVPDFQMSCSDLISRIGYQDNVPSNYQRATYYTKWMLGTSTFAHVYDLRLAMCYASLYHIILLWLSSVSVINYSAITH